MQIYTITLLICAVLFTAQPIYAKTPKPMADNVLSLTEAAAIINVCFESEKYNKLSSKTALELHGFTIRLTDLVQKIADHYNDDALYMTYEMMRVKMSSDSEIKEYSKNEYQYCSSKLFKKMESYVAENEQLINDYLSKTSGGERNAVWPTAAKNSYIDRCASSMVSQGLAKNYAHPYCTCIANGMEQEFGMKEYKQMMKAQPNPAGSAYDRRLYNVFTSCSHILPR